MYQQKPRSYCSGKNELMPFLLNRSFVSIVMLTEFSTTGDYFAASRGIAMSATLTIHDEAAGGQPLQSGHSGR